MRVIVQEYGPRALCGLGLLGKAALLRRDDGRIEYRLCVDEQPRLETVTA